MINKENGTMKLTKGMKIQITGQRNYTDKTVTAEVICEGRFDCYTVMYKGRSASIRNNASITRMNGTKCTTLLRDCTITIIK